MINVEHGKISDVMFYNYLSLLIDKIYKILPMKENNVSTITVYLDSLQVEIIGCMSLIKEFETDPSFISLLGIIQYLRDNEFDDVKTFKREVFKLIKIINKLQGKYFIKECEE